MGEAVATERVALAYEKREDTWKCQQPTARILMRRNVRDGD